MLSSCEEEQYGVKVLCPGFGDDGIDVSLLLTWHELFYFPHSVFVQADIPLKVNFYDLFRKVDKNDDAQKAMLHWLVQELHVDCYSILQLIILEGYRSPP